MINVTHYNFHKEVAVWMQKCQANGGYFSNTTVNALNKLITDLKKNNLRPFIYRLNMLCGANINAAMVPIIADKGYSTIDTNYNVLNSYYSEFKGITLPSPSTNIYMDTGLFPNRDLTYCNTHLAYWNFSTARSTGKIGCVDSSANTFSSDPPWSTGSLYHDEYNNTGGGRMYFSLGAAAPGCIIATRTGSNAANTLNGDGLYDINVIRNGALVTSSVTRGAGAIGSLPSSPFFFLASSQSSTPNYNPGNWCSNYRFGFYSIGAGLSTVQATIFYNILTTFNTNINRA